MRLSDTNQLLTTRHVTAPALFLREQMLAFSSEVPLETQKDKLVLKESIRVARVSSYSAAFPEVTSENEALVPHRELRCGRCARKLNSPLYLLVGVCSAIMLNN